MPKYDRERIERMFATCREGLEPERWAVFEPDLRELVRLAEEDAGPDGDDARRRLGVMLRVQDLSPEGLREIEAVVRVIGPQDAGNREE